MIYTVTLSPSLDLILDLNNTLLDGGVYKVKSECYRAGGRGINVSIMLKNLELESTALGFVAGFTGDEFMRLCASYGIKTSFVRARRGKTRINLRINGQNQTKINGVGPDVSMDDISYLLKKIAASDDDDFLVLAGDIPQNLPQNIYSSFFECIKDKKVKVIVDSNLKVTLPVLNLHPFLVKTNLSEIKIHTGTTLVTDNEIYAFAKDLCQKGAQNVIIVLNEYSSIFCAQDEAFKIIAPKVDYIDAVGAEDCLIAGFIQGFIQTDNLKDACIMATACAVASIGEWGLANFNDAKKYIDKVQIRQLDLKN